MDIIERKKIIDNRDKLLEKSKEYYNNNKEERQKYNNEYWASHKHKYLKARVKLLNIR